jgi:glutamate N-acetyltransferase/amino-acid N-acetyltransferase
MAVNLPPLPELPPVAGLRLATGRAGVRKAGRDDVVLLEIAEGATAAGVFTRNRFRAAPVRITGARGEDDARSCCAAVAAGLGVDEDRVLPFSTGVIGERLPAERIVEVVPDLVRSLDGDGWARAAGGILTTDTAPKGAAATVPGTDSRVVGIAKGAGMIRPDMATMLAFVATDAAVAAPVARDLLREAVGASFNRITVDGDTSTNDAVMFVATGAAGGEPVTDAASPAGRALAETLVEVCRTLAQAVVRDGEGATRFVTVRVGGAATATEALAVAYTIAESPLVKTALFAGDPNWGRLLAAIGRAGIDDLDVDGVSLRLAAEGAGEVLIAERGGVADGYVEADGARVMAQPELTIDVDLGRGGARETVWTTDLSYDYVKINAEYRS